MQIYMALTELSVHDVEVLSAVASGAAVVWVGSGFVPASRVAFRCGSLRCPLRYQLFGFNAYCHSLLPGWPLFQRKGAVQSMSVTQIM